MMAITVKCVSPANADSYFSVYETPGSGTYYGTGCSVVDLMNDAPGENESSFNGNVQWLDEIANVCSHTCVVSIIKAWHLVEKVSRNPVSANSDTAIFGFNGSTATAADSQIPESYP